MEFSFENCVGTQKKTKRNLSNPNIKDDVYGNSNTQCTFSEELFVKLVRTT